MNLDADALETPDKNGSKPLLIYDGVCGFCTYWASYWQKLTGDSVNYTPYQDVAAQYPEISVTTFQSAVQYIAPDGKRASAAEASCLTLSHARGNRFWLTLYRRLLGFAFISEKIYTFIAAHRPFFYFLSLLLWGREHQPPRYTLTSWLFLRAFGLIYLAAFISFGIEALGLIGSHGIIPLPELIDAATHQIGIERYWLLPMLFWLNASDPAIQILCLTGAGFSVLLIFNVLPRLSLIMLYLLYLSLCCAGQSFMSFQWDMLLLETGILAFFLLRSQILGIWLLRWLLFRFMFVSGMVKIMSGEPAWQNLSTLSYYFLTEPLPTPLAWFASHLPQTLLATCTAATLFIELVTPFLIFFPRRLRFIAAFSILLLQSTILITGNYNFFNLLTMLLCLSLFDDAALKKIIPEKISRLIPQKIYITSRYKITVLITWMFVSLTILLSVVGFNLRFGFTSPSVPTIWIYNSVAPLRIVNTYGPFSVITKERNEIIIEGSDDSINWREYTFKYKPGDVNRPPLWNIPLQPRLDWQLWFAALDTANNTPWFGRFIQRLLENSPDVIALLESNPFPNKPPLYIRAEFYDYQFTSSEEKAKTGAWWKRELIGFYFPQVYLRKNF
jgi:predicted DCC family thiol-disulfide oxidoreductase YuxK